MFPCQRRRYPIESFGCWYIVTKFSYIIQWNYLWKTQVERKRVEKCSLKIFLASFATTESLPWINSSQFVTFQGLKQTTQEWTKQYGKVFGWARWIFGQSIDLFIAIYLTIRTWSWALISKYNPILILLGSFQEPIQDLVRALESFFWDFADSLRYRFSILPYLLHFFTFSLQIKI